MSRKNGVSVISLEILTIAVLRLRTTQSVAKNLTGCFARTTYKHFFSSSELAEPQFCTGSLVPMGKENSEQRLKDHLLTLYSQPKSSRGEEDGEKDTSVILASCKLWK